VQAEGAPAFTRSWLGRERVSTERVDTFAEGVACRTTFDLTFAILRRELDGVVTLTEAELEDGVRAALALTHNLAEGAGAASLAAARKHAVPDGATVACVMTGGNIDAGTLRTVLH
jgi:threonine dehydratase